MSPAKSPSSSRHKGKAVAFDPPVVSEEVDRSDSERSIEEEAERDPDGECAPLIDPWYETSPHFPKVSGEYVPPRIWQLFSKQSRRFINSIPF